MKTTKLTIALMSGFFMLTACGGNGDATEGNATTDSTTTEMVNEEQEEEMDNQELAFNGVDKGEFMLYGHSEIAKDGNEVTTEEMFNQMQYGGAFKGEVIVNIDEVCQKAGCWVTFDNGDEEPIRVFFRDHFTIPTETASGTQAILLGELVRDTMTVEFQKHLLDDAAEDGKEVTQAEYDAIKEDVVETTFDCEAILVRKKKA